MPLRRISQRWLRLDGRGTRSSQLYRALRQAVLSGDLGPGARLPSTRTMAAELRLSRSTTLPVVEQLIAEGYFVSRRGSGTFVSSDVPRTARRPLPQARATPSKLSEEGLRLASKELSYPFDPMARMKPVRHEFLYGIPEEDAFPRDAWRRVVSARLREASAHTLSYSPPEGTHELRVAIMDHLARTRGVRCSAEQILITNGT